MNSNYTLSYSEMEQERLHLQREVFGKLDIRVDSGDTVCEIGCGSGANLRVAEQLTTGKYYGVDVEEKQLEAAKCYHALGAHGASNKKMSIYIAKNLYPLLKKYEFDEVKIKPIIRIYTGNLKNETLNALECFYRLFSNCKDELISSEKITNEEFKNAELESKKVTDDTYLKFSLIMAECTK